MAAGFLSTLGWAPAARAALAESAGQAVIVSERGAPIDGGGSRTAFSIRLPRGASCPGDSANDGYRVQSYMVPATVRPETVEYDGLGPTPHVVGTWDRFRQPLYDTGTSPYASALTDVAPAPGQPGLIINIPVFSFAVYANGELPEGLYNVGISCTVLNTLMRYWNTEMVVTRAPRDKPAGISWQRTGATGTHRRSGRSMAGVAVGVVAVACGGIALSRRRAARTR